jgi:DNA-binding winged helix-turn-helix (wHTH) protein/TolB-like protein
MRTFYYRAAREMKSRQAVVSGILTNCRGSRSRTSRHAKMSSMKCTRYRFGPFEFDSERFELRRQGAVIHLQSQPGRVLACLIQNADRTVSREELRLAIWGNDTFVDFERGLNFCISQLRSALEDNAARPIYIQTFPKRGYQFIAAAEFVPAESISRESSTQENRTPGPSPHVGNRRAVVLSITFLALGIVAFGMFWLRRIPHSRQPPIVAVVRFDNETGNPEFTRVSDDLTDDVVERLTALGAGRYGVIGNSRILRVSREQRDLNAIAASLHARYIVLGQVQSNGAQTRILAHLIRMPEQTHVWVVRLDRVVIDPLSLESEVAQEIGQQFSTRVATSDASSFSSSDANH